MPSPRRHALVVLAMVSALAVGSFIAVAPRVRAGAAIVFSEDFESGSLSALWNATDSNVAAGLDYWGVSDFRNHTGQYSAWCAEVGNQSSGSFAGLNNTDAGVQQYDDEMQADLSIDLRVNGYASLTLSFWYYAKTESGGGDWIQAWYEAGGVQTSIFSNVGSTGNKWDNATVAVPNDVERLIIRFHTDTANHGFEGAYVDDVVLTGIEDVSPTSSVSALPEYVNTPQYGIPYTAQDNPNASGIAYVELWYRASATGNFTMYTRPANPLGRWVSVTIPFDIQYAAGDSYYEFYTIAVDQAGNAEPRPPSPDANTTIDTTPPSLTMNAPSSGEWFPTPTVPVAWQATDALSGIDHYETSLDNVTFTTNGIAGSRQFTGLADGSYRAWVKAFDAAGNTALASVTFGVDATAPTVHVYAPTPDEIVNVGEYTFSWTAVDDTSGLDHVSVSLDGGAPADLTTDRWAVSQIADGWHTFRIVAYDRAGNVQSVNVTFLVDTNPFSLTGPYHGLPLFLLLAVVIGLTIFMLLWWKRRKDKEEERKELEAAERAEGPEPGTAEVESTPEPPDGGT